MKNLNVLILHDLTKAVEQNYFQPDTKFILPPGLTLGIQKYIRESKPVVEEQTELYKDIRKLFDKEYNVDESNTNEEYQKEIFSKYTNEFLAKQEISDLIKEFREKECNIEFSKLKQEDVDGAVLSLEIKDFLTQLI